MVAHRTYSSALVLLLLLIGSGVSAAQDVQRSATGTGVVTGVVASGDTGEPLTPTSVEIRSSVDSATIRTVITAADGRFRADRLPEGTFYLSLAHVGYATTTTQLFELAAGETRDLGTLRLPVQAVTLDPIEVSGERNAVTVEADRTSYNLGVMGGFEGASVTETLRAIPELEVDINGRITVRGSAPAIYINGRRAPMTGESLAAFLEQFPADYIEKIEVIDNPSARFGAEGSGGVVNLVLKEGVELGMSGNVFANAGTRGNYGVGGRGTLQRGDWTWSGGGFGRLSDSESSNYDLRQNLIARPPFLERDSRSDRTGLSSNLDLSARYEPTEAVRFFARGRVSGSGNDAAGFTTTTHLDEGESPILAYGRTSSSESSNRSVDVSGGVEYAWVPRRHMLEIEADLRRGRQRTDRREEITTGEIGDHGSVLVPAELMLEERSEFEDAASLNIDYTRPFLTSGRIEAGVSAEHESNDNDRLIHAVEDVAGDEVVTTQRGIAQRELMRSAYGTIQQRFGLFSVQLGVRAENRELDFELPTGETVQRSDLDMFPSASVSVRSGGRQLRLSYSRRIGRPGVSVLNPTDVSTDPAVRRVGNPDVEARYTHSINANASWSGALGNLRLAPHYTRTVNDWTQITTVDEQGVSTRTYQNLLSAENYGASLTYSLRQRGGFGGSISVSGRQNNRDASNLSARYSGNNFRWSSRANINAQVVSGLTAESSLSYSPPNDLPQGRSSAQYRADMGFRYRILDGRGSVRLSLGDPFGLRRSTSRMQDVSYIQIGRSEETTRSAQLNFSYSFGGRGSRRGR